MSETIISKRCSSCKQTKSISEFYKNRRRKNGYRCYCKICTDKDNKIYNKTTKGKQVIRKTKHRYLQTEKGKETNRIYGEKYHKLFPERRKANDAVVIAIRAGRLLRPDTKKCSCGEQAQEYHHPSYAPEHQLNVVPVCHICHSKISNASRHIRTPEKLSRVTPLN